MAKTKWNDDQKKAIFAETKNILISAGAGSGKTAVISERVLEKVKNGQKINRLLLLTFTKAAAAEMKERIREKLLETLKKGNIEKLEKSEWEEIEKRIEDAIERIDTSYICTFDSYALSVVQKYHYILNLPSNVSISDESILKVTILQLIDEIFEEYYEMKDPKFLEMIKAFVKKDDKDLKIRLLNIYLKLTLKSNIEEYLQYLKEHQYDRNKIVQFGNEFINGIINNLKQTLYILDEMYELVEGTVFDKKHIEKAEATKENIINIKNIDSYDELIKIKEYFKGIASTSPFSKIEGYSDLRRKFSGIITEVVDKTFKGADMEEPNKNNITFDDMIERVYKSQNITIVIIDILMELHQRLTKIQKEKSLYVFNDIAKMSIELVKNTEDINEKIKEEIKNSFDEIIIDEYQDTSDLQEEFIGYIHKNNVYRVGDVKQSIYGFRNANPELFSEKYNTFDDYEESSKKINQKIDLALNYRTREEVLTGINDIFNIVMTQDTGGADYVNRHQLKYGNKTYELKDPKQDYNLEIYNYYEDENNKLDVKYDNCEKEAFLIVKDITDKVQNKFQVLDKDESQSKEDVELNGQKYVLRDCKYKDFSILISKSSDFDVYKKIFEYYKVPLKVVKDESIVKGYDLNIIINILKAIELLKEGLVETTEFKYLYVSISRSYLWRREDEEILLSLTDNSYIESDLVKLLKEIVECLPYLSNKMLMEMIYEKFEIYKKLETVGDIEKIEKALDFVLDFAETHNELGINFIESLQNIIELADNDSFGEKASIKLEFKVSIPVDDAVTLMTIHGSKGLEYNICYFPGLGTKFEAKETSGNFIYNSDAGIISKYENFGLHTNFLVEYLKLKLKKHILSEKIRLFYVALTRTKQKAILITSINYEAMIDDVKLPNTFQQIIEIVLKTKKHHFIEKDFDVQNIGLNKKYLEKLKPGSIEDSGILITTNSSWRNKIPETEEVDSSSYSKKTHGLKSKEEKEKMELGTKVHYIFEMLDFYNPDINSQIDSLDVDDFLKGRIKNFFKCELTKNIRNGKIYHEYEFIDDTKHGIIDLMVEYDDHIDIIDFKLRNIEDEAYNEQLKGYQSYIEKVSHKKVYIYLYSIIEGKFLEIK